MSEKKVIVLCGATASGKTQLAIDWALSLDAEIISADSRQIYKELNIGVARPSENQLYQAPHHFIAQVSIHEPYSAGQFQREALSIIQEIFQRKNTVIICGGTGLFIQALLYGLDTFPFVSDAVRNTVNADLEQYGIEYLQEKIRKIDPEYFAIADIKNPRRLTRALEVYIAGGKPYSSYLQKKNEIQLPYKVEQFALELTKEKLHQNIENRTMQMLDSGLIDECKPLLPFRHMQALQTVGYVEVFDFLENKITYDEMQYWINTRTKQYAKRQLTWFKKQANLNWISL